MKEGCNCEGMLPSATGASTSRRTWIFDPFNRNGGVPQIYSKCTILLYGHLWEEPELDICARSGDPS